MAQAYKVAIFTRGVGAFAYTYSGPDGLAEGTVVAVTFRHRLEFGVISGEDTTHLGQLLPLCIVDPQCGAGWGELLLRLCRMAVAGASELLGHIAFESGSKAISASLTVADPSALPDNIRTELPALTGKLTPAVRKKLAALNWDDVCAAVNSGAASIQLAVAGQAGTSRSRPDWRKCYRLAPEDARWLAVQTGAEIVLPGSYLAGFSGDVDEKQLSRIKRRELPAQTIDTAIAKPTVRGADWQDAAIPEQWEAVRRGFIDGAARLRKCRMSWPAMRGAGGMSAELQHSLAAGHNVLVIAPMEWMPDRLWPLFYPFAFNIARYRSTLSPGALAFIFDKLAAGKGFAVVGGPSAWKLALYGRFDRIILIDPTHPQYRPETFPHIDPRLALMMAGSGATLELVELGLSVFDGASGTGSIQLHAQDEQQMADEPQPKKDMDPLPLRLRQPGTKRLIYFNRLGTSRGFVCMECHAPVSCPSCSSGRLVFSAKHGTFTCSNCKAATHGLRCGKCGLANIAIRSPGLEAVNLRPGDFVATGARSASTGHTEHNNVLGTSQLLQPLEGYWPEQVVYVHAESHSQVMDDWPEVADMTARLCALYQSPVLGRPAIVSQRLFEQFGESVLEDELAAAWVAEQGLRRLALLPPFGTLYRFRIVGNTRTGTINARRKLGHVISHHPATTLLRVSHAHPGNPGFAIGGHFINQEITGNELLALADDIADGDAQLLVNPQMGPWL